jgi:hypothetical protein
MATLGLDTLRLGHEKRDPDVLTSLYADGAARSPGLVRPWRCGCPTHPRGGSAAGAVPDR